MDAFAPPEEKVPDGPSAIPVATVWAMAGAALGVGVGAWAQTFSLAQTVVPTGLIAAALSLLLGFIAFRVERRLAEGRKELLDGRGRLVRPLSAWLITVPMGAGTLGFLLLVLIAWLRTGSATPLLVFVLAMVGMIGISRPVLGARALAKAVEAIESGRATEATARLLRIEAAPWWTASVRSMAALNLGWMALNQGKLEDAASWYRRAQAGRERAVARTGLALVKALQGSFDEAEDQLRVAGREGRHVQAEIDGVRMLVAFRRDGHAEARKLGDRLVNPNSGGLFLAVLACARLRDGDAPGARELLDDPGARDLLASGFGELIPELSDLHGVLSV